MKRFLKSLSLAIILPLVAFTVITPVVHADSGYNPSYLIDDGLFQNSSSMSPSDIQTFLNNENSGLAGYLTVESCNPSTPTQPDPWSGSYYQHCGTTESAAQIIYDAGQAYDINPQAIMATLEKEQSLITTPDPTASQINCAMGYNSCSGFSGFFSQVDNGTWQLRAYLQFMQGDSWWGLPSSDYPCKSGSSLYSNGLYPGNNVTFADPGGTAENVTLADFSTAALYCYTPYVGPYSVTGYSGSYNFVVAFEEWFGPTTSSANSSVLNFVRLNYYSGNVQSFGYPSISEYSYASRPFISSYPSVATDGSVVPIINPTNNDLTFIRFNYYSGNVQVVSYGASSGYTQLTQNTTTSYPDISDYNNVVPLYRPNGDLSFIRLNYSSGNVQDVSYSASSGFKQLIENTTSSYPAITDTNAVKVLYQPDGNLTFLRLNYYSGNVQLVSYNYESGFKQLAQDITTSYPDVATDGSVIPLFKPNGDLSFIRLNYSSGDAQVVSYSANSGFTTLSENTTTGYPSISDYSAVKPLFTK